MKQVLLVEDDERLSSLISQYLTKHDFIVHRLANGENLLQYIKTSPPDILLLDVMLPGENGFTLCNKTRHSYPGPLLFMPLKNDDFDQVYGLEIGADDYIINLLNQGFYWRVFMHYCVEIKSQPHLLVHYRNYNMGNS